MFSKSPLRAASGRVSLFAVLTLLLNSLPAYVAPAARAQATFETAVRLYNLTTGDIVYNEQSQRIVASLPEANSVGEIDPATGAVTKTIFVGSQPGAVALALDWQTLYVGLDGAAAVRRVNLVTNTAGSQFSVGADPTTARPFLAADIEIVPGNPDAVAVARWRDGQSPPGAGVAVYDSGVQRPEVASPFGFIRHIAYSEEPHTLYGSDGFLRTLAVNASGVTLTNATSQQVYDIQFANGLVYDQLGRVVNPATDTLVGTFAGARGPFFVDAPADRAYYIVDARGPEQVEVMPFRLRAYDTNTFAAVGEIVVPGVSGIPTELIRWGANGLAVSTNAGQLYLIQSTLISPAEPIPTPTPTPTPTPAPTPEEPVSVRQVALRTKDIINHPASGTLYASVPSSEGAAGNSLVRIDPLTAAVGTPVPVGSEPGQLALADDGQTLYVVLDGPRAVRRFDTATETPGLQFSVGTHENGQPLVPFDIEVMPGSPQTIAVAKLLQFTNVVAIYDDGVQRPDTAGNGPFIEFGASPSRLYVGNSFGGSIVRHRAGPTGLTPEGPIWTRGDNFIFAGGLIYTSRGTVVEPETATLRGTFPVGGLMTVDPALGRAYSIVFTVGPSETTALLRVFDINTFLPIGQATIRGIGFTPSEPPETSRGSTLVRWGENGLAVRTPSHVVFLRSALINPFVDAPPPAVRFQQSNISASENSGSVTVNVVRTGDVSTPTSVDYWTADGTAVQHDDYTTAIGTLHFAPGEREKSFSVLLTNDAHVEGTETFEVRLSGAEVTESDTLTVQLSSDDSSAGGPNPIDDSSFFVRQHYADFLNRAPDAPGLAHWANEIESCGADAQCREVKRVHVSAAFFLSIEFQETGFLVYLLNQAAFGAAETRPMWSFVRDTREIGAGVVVGEAGWPERLEANKRDFLARFVSRSEFIGTFGATPTPAQFVDALNARTVDPAQPSSGGALTQGERDHLVAELAAGTKTRADVLRAVTENALFRQRQFNRAFVFMQYVGYLRRNPNEGAFVDFAGFNFWLSKLNEFGGNYIAAEMVKAFITSNEYRRRFGQ
jgi:hypothetical protein